MKSAVLLRNKNLTMLAQHSSGVLFSIFRRIFLFYSIDCHSRICMCFWERVVDFRFCVCLFQKFSLLFVFLHFTHAKHFFPQFFLESFLFSFSIWETRKSRQAAKDDVFNSMMMMMEGRRK